MLEARVALKATVITTALLIAALLFWVVRHVVGLLAQTAKGEVSHLPYVWLYAFAFLFVEMLFCFTERTCTTTPQQDKQLAAARLVVNVPAFNEDPEALWQCLESMLRQTRPPDCVFVVDDGSKVDYTDIRARFFEAAEAAGVEARWERQPNAGKRHAQGRTIAATPDADFYLTVDSDAVLDPHAIEEGLKPFINPRVQSVAGVVLVSNRVNLLTKLTNIWFTVGQLVDRSMMSSVGGVLVNSGALAFYRGDLLRENLDGYLNETFFGRRIETSDDSMLTIYALLKGKAIQQPTSFSFTLMPERYSHHRRQYLRWMRGATIRAFWRFRYLPVHKPAYWLNLLGWLQVVLSTCTFLILFVYTPVVRPAVVPFFVIIPLLVGYGQGLRTFTIKRSDMRFRQQFYEWLLMPVVIFYSFFVLRALRFYAIFTCLQTGWGTRQTVEVTANKKEEKQNVCV
jgi:hyaluronan synthase